MIKAATLALCLALTSTSALADLTARYGGSLPEDHITVEISGTGHVRVQKDLDEYHLIVGDDSYQVEPSEDGFRVIRLADVLAILSEATNGDFERLREFPAETLRQGGQVQVGTWTGTAYFEEGRPEPVLVISHDPSLAALGAAVAADFRATPQLVAYGIRPEIAQPVQRLLDTGAPLVIMGAQLQSVSTAPVDVSRFRLPAEPETKESIRRSMLGGADRRDAEAPPPVHPAETNPTGARQP
jgi:hypothetical protein